MVLHMASTGETHALDPLTTLVFSTLLADPSSALPAADWLQRMIASAPGVEDEAGPSAEELRAFELALTSLGKLGLVQAAEPAGH
jgi:hypothetical protein